MKFIIKKISAFLFSTRAAGLYIFIFALAIAIGTFVENDYGTSSAQKVIYQSWWFSLLLFLFGVAILVNIFKFNMIKQKKWALATFHFSIIIILIGAMVTRYYGYEGMMHIRENSSSSEFLSSNTYLKFKVLNEGQTFDFAESVLFASLGNNSWENEYQLGSGILKVEVTDFIPNPSQNLEETADGVPTLEIVTAGRNGRQEHYLSQGETKTIGGFVFNFNDYEFDNAVNITQKNGELVIKYHEVLSQMTMRTQQKDTLYPSQGFYPLVMRSLYSDGGSANFVFSNFMKKGETKLVSTSQKVSRTSTNALKLNVTYKGETREMLVFGNAGSLGQPTAEKFGNNQVQVSYGSKIIELPFSIYLNDFILKKYPGTNNAVSYSSDITLVDERNNVNEDFVIYMNHILDYGGYRFFQSSFDKDELGTYLSVNHDFWGTWISYIGYIMLTLGMVLSLFSKKSRFQYLSKKIKELRESGNKAFMLLVILGGISLQGFAQESSLPTIVNQAHAERFSTLVVQDSRGRMKPVHTLTRELMRKLHRSESYEGYNADQIILSMFANSKDWFGVKMIKLGSHPDVKKLLNTTDKYVSYNDFFNEDGSYKLSEEVQKAYNLNSAERGMYAKELIKLDEKLNITNMVFRGNFLKIVPIPNDPNNTWVGNPFSSHNHQNEQEEVSQRFFGTYVPELRKAISSNDYSFVNKLIEELRTYQKENGSEVIPSDTRIKAEILLNNLSVFNRLAALYAIMGVLFLGLLFTMVFKPNAQFKTIYKILLGILVFAFAFHTVGLGLRWYVSERAPWSNSYESMIYIAWVTALGGVLFSRKSIGGLAATTILAGTILLVAMLTYLDPEITPLAPVLKSYWLTIHVSLEAGSYGFLLLGALMGLINLVLFIFINENNKANVYRMIKEMSYLSEMVLIAGLIMVSVGTYLGGVWANESWGRYWGWDPKETWALVTILVYAFILHMRIIPKMMGLYAYNFATIIGFASVIMTYYGVNYYLSGLHSYAAGDPVPVPQWVYIVLVFVIIIAALAYRSNKKFNIKKS